MLRRGEGMKTSAKPAPQAQAVFFDLDGTLVDTELLWADAMVAFLRDHGLAADTHEIVRIVYGHAWSGIHRMIIERYPQVAGMSSDGMAVELRPYYLRLRDRTGIAIPDSVACLRRLAEVYPVAIVSGSPRLEIADTMRLLQIEACVRFYLGSEDYAAGKPAPDCYRLAAGRLHAQAARCLVVEDSQAGVRSAKAAGMRCLALAREGALPQAVADADRVVPSLAGFTCDDVERMIAHA